jgi:ribosomal protein L10
MISEDPRDTHDFIAEVESIFESYEEFIICEISRVIFSELDDYKKELRSAAFYAIEEDTFYTN